MADALAAAIPDRSLCNFLALAAAPGEGGLAWTINLETIERDFDSILGFPAFPRGYEFARPTLFLRGERSDDVRPEHRGKSERLFPAAVVETVPGAGHRVHADAPGAFVEAVNRFLAA